MDNGFRIFRTDPVGAVRACGQGQSLQDCLIRMHSAAYRECLDAAVRDRRSLVVHATPFTVELRDAVSSRVLANYRLESDPVYEVVPQREHAGARA